MRNAAGLIVIGPRSDIVPKYKVRAENGVLEVFPEMLFRIFLSNFRDHERKFPKGMVLDYEKKHPIYLVTIVGQAGEEIYRCLNIAGEADIGLNEEE